MVSLQQIGPFNLLALYPRPYRRPAGRKTKESSNRLESGSVYISGARNVVWELGTTRIVIIMRLFCAAVNCTNKSCKGSKLSFFRFPRDTDRFVHRLCTLLNTFFVAFQRILSPITDGQASSTVG